jgi:hypothetical protein
MPVLMQVEEKVKNEERFNEYYQIAMDLNESYSGLVAPYYVMSQIVLKTGQDNDVETIQKAVEKALNDHLQKQYGDKSLNIKLKINWNSNGK